MGQAQMHFLNVFVPCVSIGALVLCPHAYARAQMRTVMRAIKWTIAVTLERCRKCRAPAEQPAHSFPL